MENRFLLTCTLIEGGTTFFWFETEDELLWTIQNNKTIFPIEAIEILSSRKIDID